MSVKLPIPKVANPFRFWCQKALPLVYDDSLSYYEILCKVVVYINNLRDDTSVLATDVDELNQLYNELKEYIDNYFANLDLQEEINIKLDKMASEGYFDTIIQNYLDLKAVVIRHDTVDDMVADTSLKIGYIVSTSGYNDATDSGGCQWAITGKKITEQFGIQLNNGLYAKRILQTSMNVECFGAYGDNINDDSQAIWNALSKGVQIIFNGKKKYKISTPFEVNTNYSIMIEGNNTTLVIDDTNHINNTVNGYTFISLNNDTIINNLNIDYLSHTLTNSICPIRIRKGDYHYWDNVYVHSYEGATPAHANCCWFYFQDYIDGLRKFGCENITLKNCKFINETTAHTTGVGALWVTGVSSRVWEYNRQYGDGIGNVLCNDCYFYTATRGDVVNVWLSSIDSYSNDYKNNPNVPAIDSIVFNNCAFKGKNEWTINNKKTAGSAMAEFGNSGSSNGIITGINCTNYKKIAFNNCTFTVSDGWQQHIIGTSCGSTTFDFNNCTFNSEYSDNKYYFNISLFNNASQKGYSTLNPIADGKEDEPNVTIELIPENCNLNFNSCKIDSKKGLNNSRGMKKTVSTTFTYSNCNINASAFYPETNTKIYNSTLYIFGSAGLRDRHAKKDLSTETGYNINDLGNKLQIYNTYIDGSIYLWHNATIANCYISKTLYLYGNSTMDYAPTYKIINNFIQSKISNHSYDFIIAVNNDEENGGDVQTDINITDTLGMSLICTNNTTGYLTFDRYNYCSPQYYDVIYNSALYPNYVIDNNNRFYKATGATGVIQSYMDSEPISAQQRAYPISPQVINSDDEIRDININVKNIMYGGYYDRFTQGLRFGDWTDTPFSSLYTSIDIDKNTNIKKKGYSINVKNLNVALAEKSVITSFFADSGNKEKLTLDTDKNSKYYNHYYFEIVFRTYPNYESSPRMDYKIRIYCTDTL